LFISILLGLWFGKRAQVFGCTSGLKEQVQDGMMLGLEAAPFGVGEPLLGETK
jgi:hypothetical protein